MIVCDDEHLGLIDATARAQRLRPPAAELRGRPRGRGDRRRAAAGGLHPRALGRAPRRRGRGARLLRGPPGGDPRGQRARLRLPPGADRRPALHALFMAMTTSARERARGGGGDVRDPRAENLAKILVGYSTEVKEGEVVSIDGESAAEPLLLAVYEEVLKAGGQPDPQRRPRRPDRRLLQARLRRPARMDLAASPSGWSTTPTCGSRSAPAPTPASSPAVAAGAPDPAPDGDRRR